MTPQRRSVWRVETLEDFYADPARKGSREISFGSGWRSSKYELFEYTLFWVASTSELCAMRAPIRDVRSDGPISRFVLGVPPHFRSQELRGAEVTVAVLALVGETELTGLLEGWEQHHVSVDGLEWVQERVIHRAGSGSGAS